MRTDPAKKDITKYCEFHRDYGHRTDDCIQLKKEIEFLIRCGHLRRYVALEDRNQTPPPPPRQPAPAHPQSNGQVEVTMRTLKAALKIKLENVKGKCVEYLPEVLWTYKTTRKSAT